MALQIPFVEAHVSVQQALDFIAQRFPIGPKDVGQGIAQAQTGKTVKTWGPLSATVNMAASTVGTQATATVTHNLGLTGTQVVKGNLQDGAGGWGHAVQWRAANVATNSLDIVFIVVYNPGANPNPVLTFEITTYV